MQVKMNAPRLARMGFLNPVMPEERETEPPVSTCGSDRVEISREGHAAAAAEQEIQTPEADAPEQEEAAGAEKPNMPNGFDFSGVDLETFDWDSWEMPTLEQGGGTFKYWMAGVDPQEYTLKKMEAIVRNFQEVEDRIKEHYQPEYEKIKNMSQREAMSYLYDTYLRPFRGFGGGTAPNGMSEDEAYMAYKQLQKMYLGTGGSLFLADPYATTSEDRAKLKTAESRAKAEVGQYYKDLWHAEHPDYSSGKTAAERKEEFRRIVERIQGANISQGTALSAEPLRTRAPEFDAEI